MISYWLSFRTGAVQFRRKHKCLIILFFCYFLVVLIQSVSVNQVGFIFAFYTALFRPVVL